MSVNVAKDSAPVVLEAHIVAPIALGSIINVVPTIRCVVLVPAEYPANVI